jgi:uncharacterized protein (DUF2461 family)
VTDRVYFGPGLLRFLKDLRLHNEREWFLANQQPYENDVRGPFLQLIADQAPGLKKISPNFIVDPRPNKGSLMRISNQRRPRANGPIAFQDLLGLHNIEHSSCEET